MDLLGTLRVVQGLLDIQHRFSSLLESSVLISPQGRSQDFWIGGLISA